MDNRNPGQRLPPALCARRFHATHPHHRLAAAVMLALGVLVAQQAEGSGSCAQARSVISAKTTRACVLGNNQSLDVTPAGTLTVAKGAAVSVGSGKAAREFVNRGSVSGTYGLLVEQARFTGSVLNAAGASLDGSLAGMRLDNATVAGSLNNAGTVTSAAGPVGVALVDSTVAGDIKNTGSIVASSDALSLSTSQVNGSIRNAGTLRSGSHALSTSDSVIGGSIINTGELLATTLVLDSRIQGDFINAGRISSGYTGLVMHGSTVNGAFINRGTLYASSGVILRQSVVGSLLNTGTIDSGSSDFSLFDATVKGDLINRGTFTTGPSGWAGLSLQGGTVGGNLVNYGTLSGDENALGLRGDAGATITGSLINRGKITGASGAELKNTHIGGSLINVGSITGAIGATDGSGLGLEKTRITGDFRNSGRISGATYGTVWAAVDVGGSLVNTGSIGADSSAVVIAGSSIGGDLINTGSITGPVGGLILGSDTLKGDLENSGVIRGGAYPLYLNDTTLGGRLINRGSVSGDTGIALISSTVGRVENSGTVVGKDAGLRLTGATVTQGLVNSGVLAGGDYSLYVDSASTLDALYIAGRSARFAGPVYAPATTAYLYGNTTYTLVPGDQWTVDALVNGGALVLQAPAKRGTVATLDGDYTQRAGAVLRTQVTDATHYGQLVITGQATLPSRARIDVDVAKASQPFTQNRLQDVLKASSLSSDGTFAVTSNSALFNFGAVKDANTVDLTLSAKSASGMSAAAASAGLTRAEGAARVLDRQLALGSASALTPYFVSATRDTEVASSLAQALPQGNASLRASQGALEAIALAVHDRMGLANGLLGNDGLGTGSAFWSTPLSYASGRTGGSSGSVVGVDTRLSATSRAGVAFAYANANAAANPSGASQSSQLDLWQFLGYRSYTLAPATELMLYAGAGNNSVEGERRLNIAGTSGTAKGTYDSVIATVGASLGHTLALGEHTRLMPALRLDFNHIRDQGYREQGPDSLAPLLLKVDARQTDQLIAGLDSSLAHALSANTAVRLNLGVGYDLINDDGAVKAAFAGAPGQRFTTAGERASPWLLRSGAGLVTTFTNGAELSLNYDAQSRSDFTDHTASVKFSVPF